MWCITLPAFLYLCGISWISPGHPFCLLLVGSVETQGRWQVMLDWGSKSSPFLVCWIFLAFMMRLIAISFALTYWVRCAVCHLNKVKTQFQSNKKPQDLIQKAIKVILKKFLQYEISVWGVQMFMGKTLGEVVLSSPLLRAGPQLGLLIAILKWVLAICEEGDCAAFVTACSGA